MLTVPILPLKVLSLEVALMQRGHMCIHLVSLVMEIMGQLNLFQLMLQVFHLVVLTIVLLSQLLMVIGLMQTLNPFS